MSVAKLANTRPRASTAERLSSLEQRADGHDKLLEPMAKQLEELYLVWARAKAINWFVVKIGAWIGGGFGAIAVILTIWEKARVLLGH